MTGRRGKPHYIAAYPGAILLPGSLLLLLLMIAVVRVELRARADNLAVAFATESAPVPSGEILIIAGKSAVEIAGEKYPSLQDFESAMRRRTFSTSSARLKLEPGMSAQSLQQLLNILARSGLVKVVIQSSGGNLL
jgi:hypothetical protein